MSCLTLVANSATWQHFAKQLVANRLCREDELESWCEVLMFPALDETQIDHVQELATPLRYTTTMLMDYLSIRVPNVAERQHLCAEAARLQGRSSETRTLPVVISAMVKYLCSLPDPFVGAVLLGFYATMIVIDRKTKRALANARRQTVAQTEPCSYTGA